MKARIVLVSEERELIANLRRLLMAESFEVELAADGKCPGGFDLIIMDAMPEVCGELRRKGIDASILMLTDKRVASLRFGADDCVARSCDPNELLARVEALLRRLPRAGRGSVTTLRFADVEIDFGIAEARKGGGRVSLSVKELRLLHYLADHPEKVVSRSEILRNVWEYDSAVSSRTVDVHIGWLRQKLEDDPQRPKYIKTIRGRGYRFDCDERSALTPGGLSARRGDT